MATNPLNLIQSRRGNTNANVRIQRAALLAQNRAAVRAAAGPAVAPVAPNALVASLLGTANFNGHSALPGLGNVSLIEHGVDRALSDLLHTSAGNSPDTFLMAIDEVFPVGPDGVVATTPQTATPSLYTTQLDGTDASYRAAVAAGLTGQITAAQANLSHQAKLIVDDALTILEGLQPLTLTTAVDADKVAELRAMVRTEIKGLLAQYGRVDEPIDLLVKAYSQQLGTHLTALGASAQVNGNSPAVTTNDERQVASFNLLLSYKKSLDDLYQDYLTKRGPTLSSRLAKASNLLRIVATTNGEFVAAMDTAGYSEAERRAPDAKLTTLDANLPDITIADYTDWVGQLAKKEGPRVLADGGQSGIDFVKAQAILLADILIDAQLAYTNPGTPATVLKSVLTRTEVDDAATVLMSQITALAAIN